MTERHPLTPEEAAELLAIACAEAGARNFLRASVEVTRQAHQEAFETIAAHRALWEAGVLTRLGLDPSRDWTPVWEGGQWYIQPQREEA